MLQWDNRHPANQEEELPPGATRSAIPPLVGTGALRRGRKDVAQVTYMVRTVTRGNPATGERLPYYGGRVDLVGDATGEGDWAAADDLVLHLLDRGSRLAVVLSGQGPSYTLSGRGTLTPVKGA